MTVERTPIINGKPVLGGKFPSAIREWMNNEFGTIRTLLINDTIWVVGIDVAKILKYRKPNNALNRHVAVSNKWVITPTVYKDLCHLSKEPNKNPETGLLSENRFIRISSSLSLKENPIELPLRGYTFINMSGIWSLVLKSHTPTAEPFQNWVLNELIPSVYRHGTYMTAETIKQMETHPQDLHDLLQELKGFKKHISELENSMIEIKSALKVAEKDVNFVKTVLKSDELLSTAVIAKDYGKSSQKFNQLLKSFKIQYQQGGRWLLTTKYAALGWKHSYTYEHCLSNGNSVVITQTKWTHKGRKELTELLSRKGIYPINPALT